MSKNYSTEYLESLIKESIPAIVELVDHSVYVGLLNQGYNEKHYYLRPLNINTSGIEFSRSAIQRIVYFNGLVVPKEKNGPHKMLNILDLSDLVNRAGYEFI